MKAPPTEFGTLRYEALYSHSLIIIKIPLSDGGVRLIAAKRVHPNSSSSQLLWFQSHNKFNAQIGHLNVIQLIQSILNEYGEEIFVFDRI